MTNPEPKSHFGKPSEVDIKDVDDSNVQWGHDAKAVADEAGLGAYGPDAQGEPQLSDDVAEQAIEALHDQTQLREEHERARFVVFTVLAALVVSNVMLWLALGFGWLG